jgi:hypothetical protein
MLPPIKNGKAGSSEAFLVASNQNSVYQVTPDGPVPPSCDVTDAEGITITIDGQTRTAETYAGRLMTRKGHSYATSRA